MKNDTTELRTMGLDLGDKESTYVVLDRDGVVEAEGKVATTAPALRKLLGKRERTVVALEVGTHSPWVSVLLKEMKHHVIVANPRQIPLITRSQRKSDRTDAETLARLARADAALLAPITHRGQRAQEGRALILARAHVVAARTALVNHIRGTVKAHGGRLPQCDADAFAMRMWERIPEGLQASLGPLLELVRQHTLLIKAYDGEVNRLAEKEYPESGVLRQVHGVGALTAVTYIPHPRRRKDGSRKAAGAGAYLGLAPRQQASGEQNPQLGITHAGDRYLRTLLVECAHRVMRGTDCDLRRFGERLTARGGKNQKKRAIIAVARKLAVLLHHLWVSGEVCELLRSEKQRANGCVKHRQSANSQTSKPKAASG
ncbi:MAG: IS110 family transposase [Dehalococcoidia bacterium]